MREELLPRLRAAHQRVAALIGSIPDAALDWQPDEDSWSLKRIVAHVAHAYDFYLLIVEQARAADFGTATLDPGMPGWRRVETTDAAVLGCRDKPAVLDQLAATARWPSSRPSPPTSSTAPSRPPRGGLMPRPRRPRCAIACWRWPRTTSMSTTPTSPRRSHAGAKPARHPLMAPNRFLCAGLSHLATSGRHARVTPPSVGAVCAG